MKESRDFAIVNKINSHFKDLNDDLKAINTIDEFVNSKEKRRAILFDFLQIGELTNQLSKKFKEEFDNSNAYRLISIRNRIVHGYSSIRDDIIFSTLKNNLSELIDELNSFSKLRYLKMTNNLLGKEINVEFDALDQTKHETIISGYSDVLTTLKGKFQNIYLINPKNDIKVHQGKVVAIIRREDDLEDILVVAKDSSIISDKNIENAFKAKEQNHKYTIETTKK